MQEHGVGRERDREASTRRVRQGGATHPSAAERHADIGQDITAVFLARDPETAAGGEFHWSIVQRSVFIPDAVNAMGHPAVAIKQAEIRATSADGRMV
jgi:hypothetical protein